MPTIVTDAIAAADALRQEVDEAKRILAFTGAGISTECGVPDFRSPGSPWLVNKPIPYAAFVASREARQEAWRRKFAMDDHYRGARPGRGHAALLAWHRQGKLGLTVTQNIDGLHQASGLPGETIVELHGNGSYARCLSCGRREELEGIRSAFECHGDAPDCVACGGLLKSATISFGQAMPADAMREAAKEAARCDLFLAIGSSLVVHPAAQLPLIAVEAGATLIIINGEPTPLDAHASLVIRADIGTTLHAAAALRR